MVTLTPAPLVIGQRFEIADRTADLIGRGGMGDVYRGRDLKTGQSVAIKALKPDLVDPAGEWITRFVREGEALRQLNHPNIVSIIETIQEEPPVDGSVHFLVMAYIDGGSLRHLLNKMGRLPVRQSLEIGLDLADALTRAHRLGIIHRDLKPGNVLLANDGTPRLTDFGLAHIAGSSSLTKAGTLIGTVDYLSPEACNGQVLNEQTDIWSFGVLLWEMLAGQPPFRREHIGATLAAILSEPVPDLCNYCPEAPDNLVKLLELMLEKDPNRRVPSMRIVGAELETILLNRKSTLPSSWQQAPPGAADKVGLTLESVPIRPISGDADVVDALTARQALIMLIARSKERGDSILGQPSLAFVYSNIEEIELDDDGAALLLRSALVHNEPLDPWLAAFETVGAAGRALRNFYDTYPRSEVRQRIVKALAQVNDEAATMTLLHITAHDDAETVRTAAALESSQRGYQDMVMTQVLAQARDVGDPAHLVTLAALVDEYNLPEESGNYLKLQVTVALAKRRWARYRHDVWRQARRVGVAGLLLALYGASTPLQMARTDPANYQSNVESAGLAGWIFSLVIFFALFGFLQGFACGFFTSVADAIWIGGPRQFGRLIWSSPAGLVYGLIMSLFLGLQPDESLASPAVFLSTTLVFGLLLGMLLSLVVPPLGQTKTRARQMSQILLVALVAIIANIPYMYLVIGEVNNYIFLSRSILVGILPLVIGLPFLIGRK